MDDLNNKLNDDELLDEEFEPSHSDKIVGLFSEPVKMFGEVSKFPAKVTDWLIPLLVFSFVLSLSTFIMQTNPQIKYEMLEKQTVAMEKNFNAAVDSGKMTQEQADTQIEKIRERMEKGGMMMLIPQVVGIVIFMFIVFFLISGFYYGVVRLILNGSGTYSTSMVAYGLPFYIASIQVVIQVIIAMLMSKMITDLSVGTFLGLDKTEFLGFFLSKLDLFSIWFYVVVGIAYAKMFKSDDTKKYIIAIIGLWLGFSFLFFYLGKAFPMLSFLNS